MFGDHRVHPTCSHTMISILVVVSTSTLMSNLFLLVPYTVTNVLMVLIKPFWEVAATFLSFSLSSSATTIDTAVILCWLFIWDGPWHHLIASFLLTMMGANGWKSLDSFELAFLWPWHGVSVMVPCTTLLKNSLGVKILKCSLPDYKIINRNIIHNIALLSENAQHPTASIVLSKPNCWPRLGPGKWAGGSIV